MQKSYFTSDLHLFARRSDGDRYLTAISAIASDARVFVLGGDIFDFRWATTATIEQAVDDAVRWLGELTAQCPGCRFHFLLGNHDHHQWFVERLAELARRAANLSWHRFYVRIGSSVFLHGDVADRTMNAEMLAGARVRRLRRRKRGRFLNRLYDLVILANLHRPVPYLVFPTRLVAKRILAYLEQIGEGPQEGVRNVYFGHTHRSLSNYEYRGLVLHNGGAPIRGLNFRVLEADVVD